MSNVFDRARLIGTPAKRLALETRRQQPIENEQGLDAVAPGREKMFWDMVREFGWVARRGPIGAYNCAGHIWATRRTGIFDTAMWDRILRDDGYRILGSDERPRSGDIVVYRFADSNEVIHVAEVVEVRELMPGSGKGIAWILSKLDATFGEILHFVENVPYTQQGLTFRYEFQTERSLDITREVR